MRKHFGLLLSGCTLLAACAQKAAQERKPALDRAAENGAPTATLAPTVQGAAPGTPVHAPESPQLVKPAVLAGVQPVLRTARAELRSLAGDKLGSARLSERAEGVEIQVELENSAPGPRMVALRASGSCSREGSPEQPVAANRGVHVAQEANLGLGALLVGERGAGALQVNVPASNLKAEQEGSLLGKALVVYPAEPNGSLPTKKKQALVACAQILAE
jgi:Cu/Zn superoxide dismutase